MSIKTLSSKVANNRLGSGPKPVKISNSVPKKVSPHDLYIMTFCSRKEDRKKKRKKGQERKSALKKKSGLFCPQAIFTACSRGTLLVCVF